MTSAKKLSFFLPNMFTALNMACGFGAVLLAWNNQVFDGALLILLGGIFDSVDGRIARLTGTQSQFGEQFDSMSDLITFGVAPSLLFYQLYMKDLGRIGMAVSFLYLLCGALRLARFNANINKVSSNFFQGLPIPGAAASLVGYILLTFVCDEIIQYQYLAVGYLALFSLLMVSNIPFCSFKDSNLVKKHKRATFFIMIILSGLTFTYYKIMIAVIMGLYVIGSLAYFVIHRRNVDDIFDWESDD